jgi:hypothetical protein
MSIYGDLVTSQHATKPKYIQWLDALCAPLLACQALSQSLPDVYSVETAIGEQLDAVGAMIGLDRRQSVAGFGLVILSDVDYRFFLRGRIKTNTWDGTNQSYQDLLDYVFNQPGQSVVLVDNQDMSFSLLVFGVPLTAIQSALLNGGQLTPKPAGVRFNGANFLTGPAFGLDYASSSINGPDIGYLI